MASWKGRGGLLVVGFTRNISATYLSAESASVLAVLGDFDLLHHLTQRSTITGTILSDDSDLLGALGLEGSGGIQRLGILSTRT